MDETQANETPERCPLGWGFNPSKRAHRRRAAVLAILAFFISLYMAFFQLGALGHAWDPLFTTGSDQVLKSKVSQAFPIPDALLAALLYLAELGLLLSGGEQRWSDAPLLTLASAGLAIVLSFGSIVLSLLQPIVVGTWCTACLLVLTASLLLTQRVLAEGFAALQALHQGSKEGRRFGAMLRAGAGDIAVSRVSPEKTVSPWNEGISVTWPLMVSILLGIGTLFLPSLFVISRVGSINIYICGILTAVCSVLAMAERVRRLRVVNFFTGMIFICWFLGQPIGVDRWASFAVGVALIGLSLRAGWSRHLEN